jgi:hypothetical protein
MAVPEDYIGQRFGAFEIGPIISSGAEGEVFECRHLINDRRYAIKLNIYDNSLWDGDEPLLPPRNGRQPGVLTAIEKVRFLAVNSPGGFQDFTPDYFAVVDTSWIRPLTVAGRVRDALTHDELRRYGSDGPLGRALERSRLWLDCAYAMLWDAGRLSPGAFDERWGAVRGGDQLADIAAAMRRSGMLSEQAAELAGRESLLGPALTTNRLFWLLVAAEVGDISAETLQATLRCPLFRLNVEGIDAFQLGRLDSALRQKAAAGMQTAYLDQTRAAVADAVGLLGQLPFTPATDPDQFVIDDSEEIGEDSPYLDGVILMHRAGSLGILDGRWVITP